MIHNCCFITTNLFQYITTNNNWYIKFKLNYKFDYFSNMLIIKLQHNSWYLCWFRCVLHENFIPHAYVLLYLLCLNYFFFYSIFHARQINIARRGWGCNSFFLCFSFLLPFCLMGWANGDVVSEDDEYALEEWTFILF